MRGRKWGWCALGAIVIALLTLVWQGDELAIGAIIGASAPEYAAREVPPGARVLEVEREGARIRAWVIEPDAPPRGTVLVLHGIHDSKTSQLPTARRLAAHGYRAVAVDLRGHGESSGRFLTYGVEDSADLSALVDALEAEGALAHPLGALGTSYGAATAIQLAGRDPRVRSVVAIAPFSSLRDVVPAYAGWIFGPFAALMPDAWVDSVVDEAGRRAGFDPDAACPRCVSADMSGSLFLIHGRDDQRIPWRQSEQIRDAGGRVELWVVEGAGHVDVGGAPGVADAALAWFDAHLHS